MILEDLKLSELRELHPDIKDTSRDGFIAKIHAKEGKQITLMDIIEEEDNDLSFIEGTVFNPEEVEAPLAPQQRLSYDAILALIKAGLGGGDKYLIVTTTSADKMKLHKLLSIELTAIALANEASLKTEDGRHEIHYAGKTFIKCTCPNRLEIATVNYKFSYILNIA
jgi:hypothetical protein